MRNSELEIATWDELFPEGGRLTLKESAPAWKQRYISAISKGDIKVPKLTPEQYADLRFEDVKKERNRRRKALRSDLEYLLDTLDMEEDGANLDAIMGLAYPLGNRSDKTLRAWGIDDLMHATTVRERVGRRQTLSAATFGAVEIELCSGMEERGVLNLGALMNGEPK